LLAIEAIAWLSPAFAATVGHVVPIGGQAADIALDEGRGVLYIANFTASRIDVMPVSGYAVARSMTVAPFPAALALSPDGRYLVVAHYGSSAGQDLFPAAQDALTVIDLQNNNQRRTFALPAAPLGVAFGDNGLALILTHDEFLIFDPESGSAYVLAELSKVLGDLGLPVQPSTYPSQVTAAALTATPDGRHIFGVANVTPDSPNSAAFLRFSYSSGKITASQYLSSSPQLGPRVVAVSRDAKYYMAGWGLFACGAGFLGDCTAGGPLVAQWPNTTGALNVGSTAIRSSRNLIYAELEPAAAATSASAQTVCLANGLCITLTPPSSGSSANAQGPPPTLMVLDSDNLTVRDRVQIPERLAGRSLFDSAESVLYSISDSGVTVFPMAEFEKAPRIGVSAEDVVFRASFCSTGAMSQEVDIVDPGGKAVPFQICAAGSDGCGVAGITISPSSGVTPAKVKITIEPTLQGSISGTKAYQFELRSTAAVNLPPPPSRGRTEAYTANTRTRFRVLLNNTAPENRGTSFDTPGELVDLLPDSARNRFYVLRLDRNQLLVYDASSYQPITSLRAGNTPTQMTITTDGKYLIVGHDNSQMAYVYDLNTLQPTTPIVFPPGHYPRSIAASSKAVLAVSRVVNPTTPAQIDLINLALSTAATLPSLGAFRNGGTGDRDLTADAVLMPTPNGSSIFAAMPNGSVLLYDASVDSFTVSRKDFGALQGSIAASSYGSYVVDHYVLNQSLVPVGTTMSNADTSSGFAFTSVDGLSTGLHTNGVGYIQRFRSAATGQILPTSMVEQPLVGASFSSFSRTLAPLADQRAIIALTVSGFTVLPWNYDASGATPTIDHIVNAGDFTPGLAPGGLIAIFGSQLSPMSMSAVATPLPTILANSCLTVNGAAIPMEFVSNTQINAQLPFNAAGNATVVLHTTGGISDAIRINVAPAAPSVFLSGTAGPLSGIPTVVRSVNGELVTPSNPIHPQDELTIYLTGMGQTLPQVRTGDASPASPLALTVMQPTVTLGGVALTVDFAGLTPGYVGMYQINTRIPLKGIPTGFEIPLIISQAGNSTTLMVRVVN
jgi:uncharacterized protein (TIGR03437 family)